MNKKTELKTKLFRATTDSGVVDKAERWANKFLRVESRTSWVDKNCVHCLEITVVVGEREVD